MLLLSNADEVSGVLAHQRLVGLGDSIEGRERIDRVPLGSEEVLALTGAERRSGEAGQVSVRALAVGLEGKLPQSEQDQSEEDPERGVGHGAPGRGLGRAAPGRGGGGRDPVATSDPPSDTVGDQEERQREHDVERTVLEVVPADRRDVEGVGEHDRRIEERRERASLARALAGAQHQQRQPTGTRRIRARTRPDRPPPTATTCAPPPWRSRCSGATDRNRRGGTQSARPPGAPGARPASRGS